MSIGGLAVKLVPQGLRRRILQEALSGGEAKLRAELAKSETKMPRLVNVLITTIAGGLFGALAAYVASDHACLDATYACLREMGAAGGAGALLAVGNLLRQPPSTWDGIDRRGDPPTNAEAVGK